MLRIRKRAAHNLPNNPDQHMRLLDNVLYQHRLEFILHPAPKFLARRETRVRFGRRAPKLYTQNDQRQFIKQLGPKASQNTPSLLHGANPKRSSQRSPIRWHTQQVRMPKRIPTIPPAVVVHLRVHDHRVLQSIGLV
jgi:hypothetical protein